MQKKVTLTHKSDRHNRAYTDIDVKILQGSL